MQTAYETKSFICIRCPLGCMLEASLDESGNCVDVTGNTCERGDEYVRSEAVCPVRVVTMVVCVPGCLEPLSVKTADAVPKDLVFSVVDAVNDLRLQLPVHQGDILVDDVCGTGVTVVATKSLP